MYYYLFKTPGLSKLVKFRAATPEDAERMARLVKGVRPGVSYQRMLDIL